MKINPNWMKPRKIKYSFFFLDSGGSSVARLTPVYTRYDHATNSDLIFCLIT